MNKETKEKEIRELQEKFKTAQAVYFTHNKGMTVKAVNELRRSMDKNDAKYRVAKNTLLRIAIEGTDFAVLGDSFKGPTGVIFVKGDPATVAKSLLEFAKKNDKIEVRGGALGGKLLSAADVDAISKLPSREQMLGMFVGVLQGPLRNLVGVLSGVPRSFVQVLHAIEEKKAA
ncbi:50S ribosomal protein L10 [bacterium]|nr:MAG: 50S ribosomal protein L10 [bacterium]